MSLTVREKEHWKERIARRIDHAIEELQAVEDPSFHKKIREQAEEQAWNSLGLDALRKETEKIRIDVRQLTDRESQLWKEMESIVTGKPVSECNGHRSSHWGVDSSVKQRAKVHEKELLQASTLGKKILHLRQEKEELLDTVWLATSPSQIKELWNRFAEVLCWEPPQLQQKALEIHSISDDS